MNATPEQLKQIFPGRIVSKAIVRDAGLPRLPLFVVEHLVANYVEGAANIAKKLVAVREGIASKLPEADNRERVKSQLLQDGEIVLVDKLGVEVNLRTGKLVGNLTFLGENKVDVLTDIVNENPRLLTGGMWGSFRVRYVTTSTKKGTERKLLVVGVMPFQSNEPDLEEFAHARSKFTLTQWVDLLLSSVGYEPSLHSAATKLTLLLRLLPVLEANVNIIELGPRQTGKTYLLRNVSPSVYTASGANVSAAALFANASTGALGILSSYKVVVLDEVSHTRFDDVSTISMLKDYMESGQFSRAGKMYSSDASMVLTGNLDVEGKVPAAHYRHLFEALPQELQDTAFLDRIHAYIPGWKVPKVGAHSISMGSGLIVDYLGQVFGKLRNKSRRNVVRDFTLPSTFTRRDIVAVEKITSALVKLLYPHDHYSKEELQHVVQTAADLRKRVNDQLAVMAPGEFQRKDFTVTTKRKVAVYS